MNIDKALVNSYEYLDKVTYYRTNDLELDQEKYDEYMINQYSLPKKLSRYTKHKYSQKDNFKISILRISVLDLKQKPVDLKQARGWML